MADEAILAPAGAAVMPAWLARPVTAPDRRRFSVLCWRGWCDHEFKRRQIAAMVDAFAGQPDRNQAELADLPRRECPFPERCDHECHDAELGWPRRQEGETDGR